MHATELCLIVVDMKYLAHVPVEQYGFISVEIEGTADDAMEAYNAVLQAKVNGAGLSVKDFNRCIDSYVKDGKLPTDGQSLWQDMSFQQKTVIDELKKSIKRLNK